MTFKTRVASQYTIERFTTDDNLSTAIAASIGRYLPKFADHERDGGFRVPRCRSTWLRHIVGSEQKSEWSIQRSIRKQVRTSSTNIFGCSKAAK